MISKPRKPSVITVIENGETRCGLTTAIRGVGGVPYRLHKRVVDENGRHLPLFENMKLQTEISVEEYLRYLDHPENADDFKALIEIDVDHNIIRVDEDSGAGGGNRRPGSFFMLHGRSRWYKGGEYERFSSKVPGRGWPAAAP